MCLVAVFLGGCSWPVCCMHGRAAGRGWARRCAGEGRHGGVPVASQLLYVRAC